MENRVDAREDVEAYDYYLHTMEQMWDDEQEEWDDYNQYLIDNNDFADWMEAMENAERN